MHARVQSIVQSMVQSRVHGPGFEVSPPTCAYWSISGAEFSYWSGGYVRDGVAVLVCFALNSYHSVTTYKWYHNGAVDVCNTYPLLYAKISGLYKCVMESMGGIEKMQKFTVLGISMC